MSAASVIASIGVIVGALAVAFGLGVRYGAKAARDGINDWVDEHRRQIIERHAEYEKWMAAEAKRATRAAKMARSFGGRGE